MAVERVSGSGDFVEPRTAEGRLFQSALSLFSEKGYDGTSIREIVERAGVTRPVLYYYFKSKEDLFRRLLETSLGRLTADIDEILATVRGCRARLKAMLRLAFRRAEESPEMVALVLHAFFSGIRGGAYEAAHTMAETRFDRIEKAIREGVELGEVGGVDTQCLALMFEGIMDSYVMVKAHLPSARLTDELADGLVDVFMDGIRPGVGCSCAIRSPFSSVTH